MGGYIMLSDVFFLSVDRQGCGTFVNKLFSVSYMRATLLFCFMLLFFTLKGYPTTPEGKETTIEGKQGSMFFYWGYNRSFYSKTNLHFAGPNYDFTLYDIKGSDRPAKFGWVYLKPTTFSIPQNNYRLGYYLTNELAVSLGVDHMKYVVEQNQQTTISGVISQQASSEYAGSYLNEPIQLTEDLLMFEHTNGFNLVSLEFEYLQHLASISKNKITFLWSFGIGGIWMVTKTDVKVLGDGLDNKFHISGYTLAGKTGPRIEYKNRYFLLGEIKGGYASLPSVLIKNSAPERGDHNLSYLEYYIAVGINFRIKRRAMPITKQGI